jgi:hypothetical protein
MTCDTGGLASERAPGSARATTGGSPDRRQSVETARLRSRNDRVVRRSLAAYLLLVLVLALSDGIQQTSDMLAIAIALVTILFVWRLSRARSWQPVRDWMPFVMLALAYELIRGFGPVLIRNVHIDEAAAIDRALLNGSIASDVLQSALRPLSSFDGLAVAGTLMYSMHTILPIVVGAYLWSRQRHLFYDFVAALVLLSISAFATYLLLPAAPPWWAAISGMSLTTAGQPILGHLEGGAFDAIVTALGLQGGPPATIAFGDISPDPVAAFPSLHAAYPVLGWLYLRQVAGPGKWLMLVYTGGIWFSIVYLGDHYLVDIAAGVVYALVACVIVRRSSSTTLERRLSGLNQPAAATIPGRG